MRHCIEFVVCVGSRVVEDMVHDDDGHLEKGYPLMHLMACTLLHSRICVYFFYSSFYLFYFVFDLFYYTTCISTQIKF